MLMPALPLAYAHQPECRRSAKLIGKVAWRAEYSGQWGGDDAETGRRRRVNRTLTRQTPGASTSTACIIINFSI